MSGVYADPWAVLSDNEDEKPTWPPPGTASLNIDDKSVPMFTSCDWAITATVGKKQIASSQVSKKPHSRSTIRRWVRQLIRLKKTELSSLGVDVQAEYVKWGGALKDLENC